MPRQQSAAAQAANINVYLASAQKELQVKQKAHGQGGPKKPYGYVHED